MTDVPFWKTRRLASRALRALDRHQARSAALGAFNLTLRPAAEQYIAVADALRSSGSRRQTELVEGKAAVAQLAKCIRAWVGQIAALRSIEGFDSSSFADNPTVPDDVINDAEALLATVAKHAEVNPETIPFLEAFNADLSGKLEVAQKEWLEAEAERTTHRDLSDQNRVLARLFLDHLIPFRRALAGELGRTHPDCHALRSSRISRELPEDPTPAFPADEVEGAEPKPEPTEAQPSEEATNAA